MFMRMPGGALPRSGPAVHRRVGDILAASQSRWAQPAASRIWVMPLAASVTLSKRLRRSQWSAGSERIHRGISHGDLPHRELVQHLGEHPDNVLLARDPGS